MTSSLANSSAASSGCRFLALRHHVSLYPRPCLGCDLHTIASRISIWFRDAACYKGGRSRHLDNVSPRSPTTPSLASRSSSETMASFRVPELDLTRFPIPAQPFINGKAVDSTAVDKHALISSVNDAVITRGQWQNLPPTFHVPSKLTACLRAPVVERPRCRPCSRGRRARFQVLERS